MIRRPALLLATAALVLGAASGVPAPAGAAVPDAPTGLAPGGGTVVDGAPILSWARPGGGSRFDVQVDDTADFSSPLVSITGTVNLRYVPVVQLPEGELWWRVRSGSGAEVSAWSTDSFTHVSQAAPVPVRPAADAVLQPPEDVPRFAWEPVAGATSYTVELGPDPEFTDPALISTTSQKTTAAVLTGWPAPATYYWRVNATLSTGYATPWSDARALEVRGLRAAQRIAPADSFAAEVREVVLAWEPVPGAATYEVQVSTDDAFLSVVRSATTVSTTWSPPATVDNDEYYWRVRAVGPSGNKAPWPAAPWRFRRAWSDQPTLTYPRGTLDPDVPLFFQWSAIEWASEYTLHLWDSSGKRVCEVDTVHTTLSDKECVPTKAGDFSWKVIATDLGGADAPVSDLIAQETAVFHYDVPPVGTGPLSVDLITGEAASLDGTSAIDVFGEPDACPDTLPDSCLDLRQTPVLTWDHLPGAAWYRVTIARDRELTNVVDGYSQVLTPDAIFTSTKTLPDSQAGSAYFWVVQPCAGDKVEDCAPLQHATHSFAKKSVAPALVAPADSAVVADDVVLDWGSELSALRDPAAAVGSSLTTPASTEARSYVVQTSVDPAFGTTIDNATVDQTTYSAAGATYPEGIVYWRVRALDGTGNPTVWSATRTFEKRSPVPALTTPAPGAELGTDYALSWTPLAFAASYDVEVYAGATKVGSVSAWIHPSWAPSAPFAASATGYTWRVRRVDAKGRRGGWSETRTLLAPGLVPAAVTPADGSTVPPGTALYGWEPEERATSYRLERRTPGTTSLAESVTTRATAWAPTAAIAAGTWEWRVVALDAAGAALGASPWRTFAVVDPPAVATPVTVSGSGAVGTELRVAAPIFDPVVDTIAYQWLRGSRVIEGATGELYTVAAADVGKAISVRATGTLAGYRSATSTSTPLTGGTGAAPAAVTPPLVHGRATVGQTLTVVPGTWADEPRVTYQWFRDRVAIPRAEDPSYRLTVADAGHRVHVEETARVTGRAPGTAASATVAVARLTPTVTLTPSTRRAAARDRITVTVGVTVPGVSAPGGVVTILDGRRRLAVVRLRTGSTGTARLPRLKVGRHVLRASYGGTAQTAPGSRTSTVVVARR